MKTSPSYAYSMLRHSNWLTVIEVQKLEKLYIYIYMKINPNKILENYKIEGCKGHMQSDKS